MKSTHSKIKIAHVQLMPLLSGVQRVSLQEFELLPNEQFDINLICKESGPLTDYLDDSVRAFFVPTLCRNISLIKDMKSLISLYKLLKKEKYDIVHTHSSKTGILGRIAARLAGVPCVVHTVHGFAFESTKRKSVKLVYKWLEIFAAKCTTRLICLHNEDKEICIKELYVDPMKISVIPNGVDLEKFAPAINKGDLKEKILGLKRNSFVFTMVGRLWPQKNPLYFAEAAKYIIENNLIPDSVFVIVGDGELMNDLKYNYQTDMNLKKRLLLLGWRNDIPNILKASDVFVLPSLWEGMLLAILEAQSTGLPCIVSNINGNNCLVKNEFDGFLIELNDIDSFINALVRVTDDKVLNIMSKNCRNKIVNEFNIVKRVDKIKDLYIDMVVNK
ncbi:glycosyltransferase family 4 protein [Escherichia coli]